MKRIVRNDVAVPKVTTERAPAEGDCAEARFPAGGAIGTVAAVGRPTIKYEGRHGSRALATRSRERAKSQKALKLRYVLGVVGLGVTLTACEQVNTAVNDAGNATDKASACAQALGLANLNPTIDPAKLQQEAGQKADQLTDLANKVTDQDLKQNLFMLADSYIALEQKKLSELGNLSDWIQRNTTNLNNLRQACL